MVQRFLPALWARDVHGENIPDLRGGSRSCAMDTFTPLLRAENAAARLPLPDSAG
jgi:hypothetical protein